MSYSISVTLDKEAPQFASDTDKAYYIAQAQLLYDSDCYTDQYNLVVALQAAHDMTIRDLQQGAGSGSSGNVTSKREGDQAISFGSSGSSNTNSDNYLNLTRYGQKIIHIKRSTILGLRASGSNDTLDDGCLPFCI